MRFCAFLVLCVSLTAGCGKKESGPAAETPKLEGVWKVVEFDIGDAQMAPSKAETEKMRFAFKGDKLFVYESAEQYDPANFTVDAAKEPKHIDVMHLDEKNEPRKSIKSIDAQGNPVFGEPKASLGIYKVEGDKLTLAMKMGRGDRPTEFKAIPLKMPKPGEVPDLDLPAVTLITLAKTGESTPEFKARPPETFRPAPPMPKFPDGVVPPLPDVPTLPVVPPLPAVPPLPGVPPLPSVPPLPVPPPPLPPEVPAPDAKNPVPPPPEAPKPPEKPKP